MALRDLSVRMFVFTLSLSVAAILLEGTSPSVMAQDGVASAAGAAQASAASTMTLWKFLGVPQGVDKLKALKLQVVNKHGLLPCLEPKPPLKGLADPANLKSPNAAIKKAAEIKMAEDMKTQKVKAIRYLASIGCGCYPGIKEALLAALDDCTEDVRLAAAKGLDSAAGNQCRKCEQSCCDLDVIKKLSKIAYEQDETACYLEPSRRVRNAAVAAIRACYPRGIPIEETPERPESGPTEKPLRPEAGEPERPTPARPEASPGLTDSVNNFQPQGPLNRYSSNSPQAMRLLEQAQQQANRIKPGQKIARELKAAINTSSAADEPARKDGPSKSQRQGRVIPISQYAGFAHESRTGRSASVEGQLIGFNRERSGVQVRFEGGWRPHIGIRVKVYRQERYVGQLEIVDSRPQGVTARAVAPLRLVQLRSNDLLVCKKSLRIESLQNSPRTPVLRPVLSSR